MLLIEYPKCSTCKKAKEFLDNKGLKYEDRNIVTANPTKEELTKWIKLSGKNIDKFFNTSGIKYREINSTTKIKEMSNEDKLSLLASDGMLVKRPLLILDHDILIGFKVNEWNEI